MIQSDKILEFEKFATDYLTRTQPPSLTILEAMKYSFLNGGKRIRARFIYTVGDMFGISTQNCNKIAFAVEAIHAYSLIHDDLPAMDNDSMRRGKPTCHIKFGEATAILAGDALQALAFETLQDLQLSDITILKKVNKLMAQCAGVYGMVSGQQLDLESENKSINLSELQTIHINKTAKMFTASLLIPYYLSNQTTNTEILNILEEISILIGVCFQIKDDILDVTESSEQLGKTSGKDVAANKSTYVSLLGIEKSLEILNKNENRLCQLVDQLESFELNCSVLIQLIQLVINRNY